MTSSAQRIYPNKETTRLYTNSSRQSLNLNVDTRVSALGGQNLNQRATNNPQENPYNHRLEKCFVITGVSIMVSIIGSLFYAGFYLLEKN